MKTILAYGDSLTWGTNAEAAGARHPRESRWPNVLGAALGEGFEVIAEGMGGRTTAFDDFLADADRNGARLLPSLLHSHRPVDLTILMLGTNDLKPGTAGNAASCYLGMKRCVEIVLNHAHRYPGFSGSKALIVSPPHLVETPDPFFGELFAGAILESHKLAGYYRKLADEFGCGFFDAADVAKASPVDGVHLDAANTRAIGLALAPVVRSLLVPS